MSNKKIGNVKYFKKLTFIAPFLTKLYEIINVKKQN